MCSDAAHRAITTPDVPQTTQKSPPRIQIENVRPVVDCGRYAPKRSVGDVVEVTADIFRDGHEQLQAVVRYRAPSERTFTEVPMQLLHSDLWHGAFAAIEMGRYRFTIEAWVDRFASWREEIRRKVEFGQPDLGPELTEGVAILAERAPGLSGADRELAERALAALRSDAEQADQLEAALDPLLAEALARHPRREEATRLSRALEVDVDRERARFGAWYELFPRSFGGFEGVQRALPRLAELGFDVIYLPPIHPIGVTHRKGRNNSTVAAAGDPGSPWAIGAAEGGHDAIHPDLGTIEDFDAFVARAHELGLEVALDLALQAAPDHPWVAEHPEWFTTRVDGSIAYAENPPKKYQDIYPLNFDNDPQGIYAEVERIVRYWMGHGVRIFRVDNPHTKPVQFWEWLLGRIRATDPDVIFLAEAFTRPAMMHTLGKVGFQQSYTYFTWRTERYEIEAYLRELAGSAADYMRPNFFVNTPDILHAYLQHGGPGAFAIRAILATTLSPTWGMYSGYELYEHLAVRPGSEEYLDSEKYQLRPRDFAGAIADGRSLAPLVSKLNRIRREHPALQQLRNIHVHRVDNPDLTAYSKRDAATGDTILVVCTVNPHEWREATVSLDLDALGLEWDTGFSVRDLLSGDEYTWGEHNYVRLDPLGRPAHIFEVHRV
jgi:starch synthase (maltosyl-transferring)